MPKGDTNKGEEFIYKLSLDKEFQKDLSEYRVKIPKPPKSGISNPVWERALDDFIQKSTLFFKKKYKIPFAYVSYIAQFLVSGKIKKIDTSETAHIAVMVEPNAENDLEMFYRSLNEPFIKLLILDNATKTEVLEFVNRNWNRIESSLNNQRGFKRKRIRATTYKTRTVRIKELLKMNTTELRNLDRSEVKSGDKISVIVRILAQENYGKIDDGYIRKLAV